MKKIISFLFISVIVFSFSSCNKVPEEVVPNVIPPVTQIKNEFAEQLPGFKFSAEITDSYDESLRYSFSVKCSNSEFRKYLGEIEDAGFVYGFPEQEPVSGKGYYKASNDKGYMVEIVHKDGVLTVHITRP
ncbi:MAG: hypothetical protein IKB88_01355 [Clostridia bacterium]|nr:hypothetical protein [Clostridia bacterium]